MPDLGTHLREHYEQISPPLDAERLMEQFIGADRYRQRRRPAVAMAAAAVLTFLVIGVVGVMVLGGDRGPDVIETPQPSTPTTVLPPPESQNPNPEVFTFAEDNLCEWVSTNEVTSFVRSAYALAGVNWNGTVVGVAPEGSAWDLPGRDYCRWETTEGGYMIARGLTLAQFGDPNVIVEYSGRGIGFDSVSGHPDMAEGVIAGNAAFGRLGFWLEGSGEVLGLEVVLGGNGTAFDVEVDNALSQKMVFNLANSFLRDMNWVPNVISPGNHSGPNQAPAVNQGAVFDVQNGVIIYVDGEGATWTFDVATNTWEQVHSPIRAFDEYAAGDLVYDVDSDRTIGIDSGVNIFDAASGSWTRDSSSGHPRGAVYDPVSGLVVVAFHDGSAPDIVVLRGYDVDTGEWSELGTVEDVWAGGWMFLVGYSRDTDELILHGGYAPDQGDPLDSQYTAAGPTTVLHNPRTGTTTVLPGGPNLFSAWGVWYPYATGVDGAVLLANNRNEVEGLCHFGTVSRSWDCSLQGADGPGRLSETQKMVYDPINDRLVVIYSGVNVWAVDLDTGQWTELV